MIHRIIMAVKGKFVLFCSTFIWICSTVQVFSSDMQTLLNQDVHYFDMVKTLNDNAHFGITKRSVQHNVQKRQADGDSICQTQEKTFLGDLKDKNNFKNMHLFENETKFSIALAWAGEEKGVILVVTTEEVFIFAKPSTLYRSSNNGKTFTEINDKINNATIRKDNGLQKHPHNSKIVYLVAHTGGRTSDLYFTKDRGEKFNKVALPFLLEDNIVFHPEQNNEELLLARDSVTRELYLSKDGGRSWKTIKKSVMNFKWGTWATDNPGTIYVTTSSTWQPGDFHESEDNQLEKSQNIGESWVTVQNHVYTFGMEGKFLYASIKTSTDGDERVMKVSTNGGKTWAAAQLPTITQDRFYSILDMTEGLIFMHVDNPGDTGHGTLYTSGGGGVIFTESLEKHLYPNNYQDLTDFYKVKSMRGVYLASQLKEDQSIHTMISFDRGGEWRPVKRPDGVPCKDEAKGCYLQIHNMYSLSRGIQAQPPLSVPSAVGIIMVHGHVADTLQTTPPDVFVSSDGGYNFIKSLDGPHHYQIADQGGLLLAIPANTKTPDTIKFSTDEGRCWHSYKFTNDKITFTGLLTEPSNKAMSVGIWGFGEEDHKWRVNVLNFAVVIDRACEVDDYETWMAHSDNTNNGCLLGSKETFQRLQKDSWCKNGYSHEVTKTEAKCDCTYDDFECDYGYIKTADMKCVEDEHFKGQELDICLRGHEEKIVTKGYRKIPGDKCSGGFQPKGDKLEDLHKKCSESVELIKESVTSEDGKKKSSGKGVLVGLVVAVLVVAFVAVAYLVHKYNLLRKHKVTYRYSSLNQEQEADVDNEIEYALSNHTSLYQDSSDEETASRENINKHKSNYGANTNASANPFTNKNGNLPNSKDPPVSSYHDDSDDDLLE